ncbi:MAG: hypothetical protein VCA73_00675, partial [Roseibacillus sp.]
QGATERPNVTIRTSLLLCFSCKEKVNGFVYRDLLWQPGHPVKVGHGDPPADYLGAYSHLVRREPLQFQGRRTACKPACSFASVLFRYL